MVRCEASGMLSLWLYTLEHVPVSVVSNGVDVRGHFRLPPPLEHVHHFVGVDGEASVRVHSHAEQPGVSLEVMNSNMNTGIEVT